MPGSITVACPRMRTDEAPTSQKNVPIGEDHQRSGRPMTKRAVYSDFCVITWSPTCIGSGAVERDVGGEGQGGGEETYQICLLRQNLQRGNREKSAGEGL